MKASRQSLYLFLLLIPFVFTACGDDEDTGGMTYFRLSSESLGYSGNAKEYSCNVPFARGTYTISVETTGDVTWSATVTEGSDFVTVSPAEEQTGNGEITVTVAASTNKTSRSATVAVTNSIDNIPTNFILRQAEKELYFPEGTQDQSTEDFYKETSIWNVNYMIESDNVAILWDRTLGRNPKTAQRPFDPEEARDASEEIYAYLRNKLKFASKPGTFADKYKLLVFVENEEGSDAAGGGDTKNKVAMLWIKPASLNEKNYRVFYHEMCHCFQYIAEFDGAADFRGVGPFYEMTSQWCLVRRFPDWINQERSHFNDFMDRTHLALGCEENQYHSPYMLEYWATIHGVEIISTMWQNATAEDQHNFINTYKRLTGTSQEKFNEEVFDAATRFITWDLPHIDEEYNRYGGGNVHECELDLQGTTYTIAETRCPRNYGYNGIKLNVPAEGTNVSVDFQGITSSSNFTVQYPDRAEWRWGFLAVLNDGSRVYGGDKGVGSEGTVSFTVPANTAHLWLVVAATPTTYWASEENEWPYRFTLTGTEPDGEYCTVNN